MQFHCISSNNSLSTPLIKIGYNICHKLANSLPEKVSLVCGELPGEVPVTGVPWYQVDLRHLTPLGCRLSGLAISTLAQHSWSPPDSLEQQMHA